MGPHSCRLLITVNIKDGRKLRLASDRWLECRGEECDADVIRSITSPHERTAACFRAGLRLESESTFVSAHQAKPAVRGRSTPSSVDILSCLELEHATYNLAGKARGAGQPDPAAR